MAMRKITVDGGSYRYVVVGQYPDYVTLRCAAASGERLEVRFPCSMFELWSRAQWQEDGRPVAITPSMVATCIRRARSEGWGSTTRHSFVANGWEWFPPSAAWAAVVAGDAEALAHTLDDGADPNEVSGGMSILAYATHRGHLACISELLQHGADPNAPSIWLPLCEAVRKDQREIAELLLATGASPDQREGYRGTAREEAERLRRAWFRT